MSTLEFISSIRWPVTVLLLATMATALLKRSPETRRSIGAWFKGRNLRVSVAGQEIEATVAETQGSMDLATSADRELAEVVADIGSSDGDVREGSREQTGATVEAVRRRAVAALVQSAVRLGWQWSQSHDEAPIVKVSWAGEEMIPQLRLVAAPSGSAQAGDVMTLHIPTGNMSDEEVRTAAAAITSALVRGARNSVTQQQARRNAVDRFLRTLDAQRSGDSNSGPEGDGTHAS